MIAARAFIQAARSRGFGLYAGVPCSYLKPFINCVIDSPDLRYIGAANEGDAVAIAAGAELAGQRAVAMFQNSGLGNAVNPLTSLTHTFGIPVLLITTLRGEPGGPPDEPQHQLMGEITTGLLALMGIPWEYFPAEEEQLSPALDRALTHMETRRTPYALVMKKGTVAPHALESRPARRPTFECASMPFGRAPQYTRTEMLRAVQHAVSPGYSRGDGPRDQSGDLLIATTGYTGRELYACQDRANQLYMVGSMGCASSFALGVASAQPRRRVIVLDGDGALLMRLGALTTIGYERPNNLLHIVLDNEVHESTGGQSTVSHSVDFCAIAAASGYPTTVRIESPEALEEFIAAMDTGLRFAHIKIRTGVPDNLPRPSITPAQVADRTRDFLAKNP